MLIGMLSPSQLEHTVLYGKDADEKILDFGRCIVSGFYLLID